MRTVRIMSDWSLPPFYTQDEPGGLFELTDAEFLQAMFDLPDSVIEKLLAWDQIYQDHLNWDDPKSTVWPSPEAYERYIEEGRAAARFLRRHLPPDVGILYWADGYLPAAEPF